MKKNNNLSQAFVNRTSPFDPRINFWEANPQFIFIQPFYQLYQLDGGGETSSKYMWVVTMLSDPDETENKFYRFEREYLLSMLNETYFTIEESELPQPLFNECVDAFPNIALDKVQKALKRKIDSLDQRATFLADTPYNEDNMKDLDAVHSKTGAIMEDYKKAEALFLAKKSKSRVKGGRRESASEQKLL